MPPLMVQMLVKAASMMLVYACGYLGLHPATQSVTETAIWCVGMGGGVVGFIWTSWRHHVALNAAKPPVPKLGNLGKGIESIKNPPTKGT